ncbi:MAG TPA: ligase-associated DNA damage response DEXH box helicase [Hyphomicrobiaceae bacterium]|nr:ligase-associated DNA damage response DEXH box helicase [Hyphomicrobiaceae bacterium]
MSQRRLPRQTSTGVAAERHHVSEQQTEGDPDDAARLLPDVVRNWFQRKGWTPRQHQLALLSAAAERQSTLLIAPTGAGKTLAGFLPSLVGAHRRMVAGEASPDAISTLYISPLKALAVDIARNLAQPISEMGLGVRIETRTGDTPASRRARQRSKPPHILLTTPEQISLLLSGEDAPYIFRGLDTVILDELHALAPSKRGDLLALGLSRLRRLAPGLLIFGLSATVARPSELRAFIVPQACPGDRTDLARLVELKGGAPPRISILDSDGPLPWAGHTTLYAIDAIYRAIQSARLALLFVNTRMQAELLFHALWRVNEQSLPIALHHGSLDVAQRRKVEAAMADGRLRAVVATSTLDLGIDWGDVDLVIHVGAPKGASRLLQRVGRSNHRLDEPSRALLVPSNRFEALECRAAIAAASEGSQDAVLNRHGALDVLAQHIMGRACSGPFDPGELFAEVTSTLPFATLSRASFDRAIDLVATGGYALRAYERFARIRRDDDGQLRVSHPRFAQQYRLNIGTIVESPLVKVRLVGRRTRPVRHVAGAGGRILGEVDEWYLGELTPGDTFMLGGVVVRFETMREGEALVTRANASEPMIPSYSGGKFPLSTHLAGRVRRMLADRTTWTDLPASVVEWLALQAERSTLPAENDVLVETFPRNGRHYLVLYPFEGRLAHQTLGMLLTRRLNRHGRKPLGFTANDYALSIWCASDLSSWIRSDPSTLTALLAEDMLGDDLDDWLAESGLMKRTFRMCAIIAGLIERRHPGKDKSGRQLTVSATLIYDVLRRYDPQHMLLEAARTDAATGLLDIHRLGAFLSRIRGGICHIDLSRASPLSVPLLLEIGRESVHQALTDDLLREAAALVHDATGRNGDWAADRQIGSTAAAAAGLPK